MSDAGHQTNTTFAQQRVLGTDPGEKSNRNVYRILVGKPEGMRPIGRPKHRWEYNIQLNLREIGWGGMDWIGLAQHIDQGRLF
jgi:hypothetical protein